LRALITTALFSDFIMQNLSVIVFLALFVCGLQAAAIEAPEQHKQLVHVMHQLTGRDVCYNCATELKKADRIICCQLSELVCPKSAIDGCF
jgi:hypothetical protein